MNEKNLNKENFSSDLLHEFEQQTEFYYLPEFLIHKAYEFYQQSKKQEGVESNGR
ncbi:MAG: hypothetical protein Q8934_08850 [Bacillota bacterium]|nr:hypothetical protein [Bacillota bacterium]